MTTKPLIGYVRVSTAQQGRSGLGIEAQREALERSPRPKASSFYVCLSKSRRVRAVMHLIGVHSWLRARRGPP